MFSKPVISIRKHYYYKVELDYAVGSCNDRLVVKDVSLENVEDIRVFRDELSGVFHSFLKDGNIGIYGYMGNRLVAYAWCILNQSSKTRLLRGFFQLPINSAYVHYCRVDSLFQGQKIYQTMLHNMYQIICNRVDSIYLDTQVDNVPAQSAIMKSGGVFQGVIVRLLFLGKDIYFYKTKTK